MAHALVNKAQQDFKKTLEHLLEEYSGLQIGRASSSLVENLMVEAYGMMQPVKAIASVMVPDGRTVQIQPWDKSMLAGLEKAIRESELNLNPTNNGLAVILTIPSLTEERRRDLVKVVGRMAEEARISVRNLRHEVMTQLKRMEHEAQLTEDERTKAEKDLQEEVNAINAQIDQEAKKKETTIMTV
ncbi:ribosome recycling factor [Candidatus Peregrinibacteria bacterium]|nr:MAG: ribosome recycling factor [Candidatus Peregrinibacteria bacterium]